MYKNMQSLYNASKPKELDADMQCRILPGATGFKVWSQLHLFKVSRAMG